MPNKIFDTIAGCVFLIVGMFFIVASTEISASSYGSKVGPNIFPTALGAILVLLSVIVITQARRVQPSAEKKEQGTTSVLRWSCHPPSSTSCCSNPWDT